MVSLTTAMTATAAHATRQRRQPGGIEANLIVSLLIGAPQRGTPCALARAARAESLAAFDGRCIPGGCVAPPSNTAGILGRRALPAGRLARLGATPDLHHGLLAGAGLRTRPHC